MSGKKNKGCPFWFDCSKCKRRLPRNIAQKHAEVNCKISYPFIQNDVVHVTLSKVTTASKISSLPFIETRHAASMIFLSDEIIKECGFTTFSWIIVNSFHENEEGTDIIVEKDVPIALRVWPVLEPNSISGSSSGAFLTKSAFSSSPWLTAQSTVMVSSIISTDLPFQVFPSLQQGVLEIVDLDLNVAEEERDRLVSNFKRLFKNRVVINGNVFRVKFYSELVKVHLIVEDRNNDKDLESIEQSLSRLTIDQNLVSQIYEITEHTNLITRFNTNKNEKVNPKEKLEMIEDVGGLQSVIDDLSSTIRYILQNANRAGAGSSLSAGIILYGHHGTGKSLLTKAMCNFFQLNIISYQEFGSPSKKYYNNVFSSVENKLVDVFTEALRNTPSAIIIENLDVVGTKVSRSESNSSFITQLRSEIEKLNSGNAPVVVLATCTDLDAVYPALRAPHIFGKEIECPVPSVRERQDILRKLVNSINHELSDEDIKNIAGNTHGFVGADLKSLLSQSYLHAQKESGESTAPVKIKEVDECIKIVHPSAMKSILIDVPNVKWEDIGGQKDLKFKLRQAIEWPLTHPESFRRLGITPPKGILMYGPPGCSKTMIAKAIATESGLNFISVKGSELFSKWVGESEKAVRSLFRKARQVSPCVVFFDEIDSLGGERGSSSGGASNVQERVLAQLLIEIDGIEPLKDVTIVAATNRPDIIDPALLRPGRLDRIIYVPLPDSQTRKEIFNIHFKKMPVSDQIDIEKLVQLTERYSGAELTAVCHEAALKALEENINSTAILEPHFLQALEFITPRTSPSQIKFYEKYSQLRQE